MPCLDENAVVAYLDGASAELRSRVEAHVDGCSACRELLAAAGSARDEPAVDAITLAPGASFGRFCVERVLGAGATGVVHLARDTGLARHVALKLVRRELCDGAAALARFELEATATARVAHPNIAAIYEVGVIDGTPYLAGEHLEGRSLAEILAAKPVPRAEALRIGVAVAEALAEAHRRGLAHTDLKPSNVHVGVHGTVKVLDFGLARALATGVDGSATGDVRALGALLFELLTGSPPPGDATPPAALDPSLQGLLAACLAKDPEARPEAVAVAAALAEMARGSRPGVAVGDTLAGSYRVEDVLGAGGMGVVVAARHLALGELRAIKVLHPRLLDDQVALERFWREARASAQLRSAHVVRTYDFGYLADGAPFIVMEHLEGSDLRAHLKERGQLPPDEALALLAQALEGIAEAHRAGIVHRDLKPANLFLTRDERGATLVKVLDFGISKLSEAADQPLTMSGDLLGTPLYMAPEQLRASRDVDARADVWSLGVILYEMLSGVRPFQAGTLAEVVAAVLSLEPAPLAAARPGLSPALLELVARCLAKNPAQRFAGGAELASAVASLAEPPAPRRAPRRVALAIGGVTLAVAAGAAGTAFFLRGEAPAVSSRSPASRSAAPAPSTSARSALPADVFAGAALYLADAVARNGGHARVYDASFSGTGRVVLEVQASDDPQRVWRFTYSAGALEARTTAPLNDTHRREIPARLFEGWDFALAGAIRDDALRRRSGASLDSLHVFRWNESVRAVATLSHAGGSSSLRYDERGALLPD